MDSIFADAKLTTLADKSDSNKEDSCTNAICQVSFLSLIAFYFLLLKALPLSYFCLHQDALYLRGLKQSLACHRQQTATQLETARVLEEENKLESEKKRLETENHSLTSERNTLRNDLRLKANVFTTLEAAMGSSKIEHASAMDSVKEFVKAFFFFSPKILSSFLLFVLHPCHKLLHVHLITLNGWLDTGKRPHGHKRGKLRAAQCLRLSVSSLSTSSHSSFLHDHLLPFFLMIYSPTMMVANV